MAQAETRSQHVELRPNRSGQPRAYLAGTRVRVQDIYAMAEIHGLTPDEIARSLPHLSLAQVHAALAYYFENRVTILDEIRQDQDFVRHFKAVTGPGPLEAKLGRADDDVDSVPS
jgi:uncharacterized protein (DUF433 family)